MENRILKLIKKLVKVESISSKPDKLVEVVDVVENFFANKNVYIDRHEKHFKQSIVISNTKEKKKTIILNGHIDVVNAKKHQFKLKENGDILTGRGVFDMKSLAAMLIIAFDNIIELKPELSIALVLTTDEEIGGSNGMEYLIRDIGYTCDVAYIPDGGGHFNILTEEKGLLQLRISAKGKSSHSAYPWRGENAIDKLINLYSRIIQLFPLPESNEDWHTSVNLSQIAGGSDVMNKVPDKAVMHLDIRFPYPLTAEEILNKIYQLVQKDHYSIETLFSGSTFRTDPQNEYIQIFKSTVETYLNRNINFTKSPGASDARYLTDRGIPVIITRCEGGGLHGIDEWISLPSLLKQYDMLMEFLKKL